MSLSFIKLDINIMNDSKVKLIRKLPDGAKLFELWIGILCLGMKSGKAGVLEIGDGIPFNDEMLSTELDININVIRMGIETFIRLKMIEVFDDSSIYITNFEKHQELKKIEIAKRKNRTRVKLHRDKQKKDVMITYENVTPQTKTKTKTENKIQTKNDVVITFPINLNNSSFKSKWEEWTKYRKELKKSLTPSSAKSQIAFLSEHFKDAVGIIECSIMNGWTGLFALKNNGTKTREQEIKDLVSKMDREEV